MLAGVQASTVACVAFFRNLASELPASVASTAVSLEVGGRCRPPRGCDGTYSRGEREWGATEESVTVHAAVRAFLPRGEGRVASGGVARRARDCPTVSRDAVSAPPGGRQRLALQSLGPRAVASDPS